MITTVSPPPSILRSIFDAARKQTSPHQLRNSSDNRGSVANGVIVNGIINSAAGYEAENSYLPDLAAYAVFVEVVANFTLPIIIVLGIFANAAVFCLLRQWPRRDSIHIYLTYLTLVDGLILLSGSGYTWLCYVAEVRHLYTVELFKLSITEILVHLCFEYTHYSFNLALESKFL